jgi:hypothetical protein
MVLQNSIDKMSIPVKPVKSSERKYVAPFYCAVFHEYKIDVFQNRL